MTSTPIPIPSVEVPLHRPYAIISRYDEKRRALAGKQMESPCSREAKDQRIPAISEIVSTPHTHTRPPPLPPQDGRVLPVYCMNKGASEQAGGKGGYSAPSRRERIDAQAL